MARLGADLARRGWVLRSGGSPGADSAFELGCDEAAGRKEIYLPWKGFNGSDSPLFDTSDEALEIALRIHRRLRMRSWRIRRLRARNVCQILGHSLNGPSNLVIAWTNGGKPFGGSSTVLALAREREVPVLNLGAPEFANTDYATILSAVDVLPAKAATGLLDGPL